MKERMRQLGAQGIWLLCRFIAILPYWFQYYVLQEIICFILQYVVRYRRKLILRQLSDSFPEKSEKEIRQICRKFYDTLAESVVNTITMAGMRREECERRVIFKDMDDVRRNVDGRNVVLLTSHYGFWEYYCFVTLFFTNHYLVGAYHRLNSPMWNDVFLRIRSVERLEAVSSERFMRQFVRRRNGVDGRAVIAGLISDQNVPRRGDNLHWYKFLNHDSLFFDGGEQLALRFDMPVYYVELNRLRRGYYECRAKKIYEVGEKVERYEITERYVRSLEESVRRRPELWLWSHNRWKARRPAVAETDIAGEQTEQNERTERAEQNERTEQI